MFYKSNKLSILECNWEGVGELISSDDGRSSFVSNKSINSFPEVAGVALALAFSTEKKLCDNFGADARVRGGGDDVR